MTDRDRLSAELMWAGDLKFGATSSDTAIVLDGDSKAGPSPMEALLEALAGCMAIDVVMIVTKGRHPLKGLRVSCSGDRAPEAPRRFLRVSMTFHLTGTVPPAAVERAIALSRERYCSVWHSLGRDIALTTAFDVHP